MTKPASPAEKNFRDLVVVIGNEIVPYDYRRRGTKLVRETDECWQQIGFEKSTWSSASEKTIFVEVAIAPKRWVRFLDFSEAVQPPQKAYYWAERLGFLTKPPGQQSWKVSDDVATFGPAFTEIRKAIRETALPFLDACQTEAGFLTAYRDTYCGPGYDGYMLRLRIVRSADLRDVEGLAVAIAEFKARFAKPACDEFLGKIVASYPYVGDILKKDQPSPEAAV